MRRASWSSEDARWTVEAERGPKKEVVRFTCNFLWGCAGYYDYNEAHTPEFVGQKRFAGRIVHPQFWSDDIDYAGKRVVVIGSGATAVTLVPAMANDASHVVMLQRSPTYIVSLPSEDAIAGFLRRRLPSPVAYSITRWKNVMLGLLIFQLSRRRPAWMKKRIMDAVRKQLGEAYDVDTHFNPSYSPWDQRLCLVPDADLFESIKSGKTSVVTGEIETFTERGIRLKSGEELDADLIVTATGLKLRFFGGIELTVDGRRREAAELMAYKGMMFSEVPNLACTFGYTNASWTLKADLTAEYVCRLLQHMDAIRARKVVPRRDPAMGEVPFLDFSSGYVQRALSYFPKQGEKRPWRLYQNYALDILTMRFDSIDDGTLEFSGATDFSGTTGSPRREKRSAGNGRARVSNAAD